jgi:hypothetical protein
LARLHANLLRAVEAVFSDHTLQVGEFDVLATLRRVGEPYAKYGEHGRYAGQHGDEGPADRGAFR